MLAGLVCSLLVARLLADVLLPLAVVVGLAALLGTAGLGSIAIRRFRRNADALHAQRPVGDGRLPALISAVVALTAVGALVFAVRPEDATRVSPQARHAGQRETPVADQARQP